MNLNGTAQWVRKVFVEGGCALLVICVLNFGCTKGVHVVGPPSAIDGPANASQAGSHENEVSQAAPAESDNRVPKESPVPAPVVLVVGGGYARGLAVLGMIKQLVEMKTAIRHIYGTDIAGVTAALFAISGGLSRMEWSAMKFTSSVFIKPEVGIAARLLGKFGDSTEDEIDRVFKKAFANRNMRESKIPITFFLVNNKQNGKLEEVDQGELWSVARLAVSVPWLSQKQTEDRVSASSRFSEMLVKVGEKHEGPILALNTIGETTNLGDQEERLTPSRARAVTKYFSEIVKGQKRDSDNLSTIVMRPDLSGIGELSFEKKQEIAFRGAQCVRAKREAIRAAQFAYQRTTGGIDESK